MMYESKSGGLIFAIDPGNEYSAYVLTNENLKVIDKGKVKNDELLEIIYQIF